VENFIFLAFFVDVKGTMLLSMDLGFKNIIFIFEKMYYNRLSGKKPHFLSELFALPAQRRLAGLTRHTNLSENAHHTPYCKDGTNRQSRLFVFF
jgi:hypothetical protein